MESKWLQVVTIMKKEAQLLLSFLVFGKKQKSYLVTYEASRVFSVSKLPFSFALHLSGHSGPESVCSRQRHPMKLSTSPIGKLQLSPLRYGKELCPYANYSSFVKKFLTGY